MPCLIGGGPTGEYRVRGCDGIFSQCQHSDCIIVIGANPTVNHPVAATFIKNAAQRGADLFILDPRGQALDRYATASLRFKPGSDVALLNAMINTIIKEQLFDAAYVESHTEGFSHLAERTETMTAEAWPLSAASNLKSSAMWPDALRLQRLV